MGGNLGKVGGNLENTAMFTPNKLDFSRENDGRWGLL